MKYKIGHIVRRIIYVFVWVFILYLGINVITRGIKIIYGKPISEMLRETAENITGRMGVRVMEKTGFVFSYLYDDANEETLASKIFKKTYLLKESAPKNIDYPAEDNMYDELLADFLLKKKFEDGLAKEDTIPVITIIPDYYNDEQGVGDIGDEPISEVITPVMVRPPAPGIIGKKYTLSELKDFNFMLNKFYAVETNTTVNKSILNAADMLGADMTLKNDSNKYPQILIYHTHSQETYADSRKGVPEDSIVGMGEYLAEILERDYGYNVLHVTTAFDYVNGKLDRSTAYEYAQEAIDKILETYPSIEVVLDIHRDGVNEDVRLVTEYNGKKTAKIMFVNGISRLGSNEISYLGNPNLAGNLSFSMQLQLKGEAYFPGLMRRIIIKAYRYNLHFKPKSALIELGAQTNTVEEARNAIELLAVMLGEVLE